MATKKLFFLFIIFLSMVGTKAYAYDIAVVNADGVTIYYSFINDGQELEVSSSDYYYYISVLNIPKEISFSGKTYKVTSIGELAFDYCSKLTSVTIPSSVITIGYAAFEGCTSLGSIDIPNSVTTIGRNAFYGCNTLRSVTIPNSVISIGESAFSGCAGLTSVIIEEGLTIISEFCFGYCTALSSINLPNSLVLIGNSAFFGCANLPSCIIPNSVKTISRYAFYGCKHMTSMVIGSGCDSISYNVFGECFYLDDVYCYAEKVPNTHSAVFGFSYVSYATLHVPTAALQAYKGSSTWSKFGNIVALTDSDPKPAGIKNVEGCKQVQSLG